MINHRALAAYLRRPGQLMWLMGMLLFVAGNILNFVSFAFAAQSLLAALAVVQFVANVVFARLINGEVATRRVLCATGVVIVGCILLVAFGNHESPVMDADDLRHLYTACVGRRRRSGPGTDLATGCLCHSCRARRPLHTPRCKPLAVFPAPGPHTSVTWWGC